MDKTEKLKHIILSKYNSVREFSKIVEIPSTTLASALDKGIGGMAVDRIIKICDILNIDIKTFEPLENNTSNNKLSKEENTLLENFNKLNNLGKKEANKRVIELSYMPMYCNNEDDEFTKAQKKSFEARRKSEQYFKEHPEQMPIASHDKKGDFSEEDYKHDDDLMMDDNIWND
ncbi:hypothetical protein CBU02nite_32700 [Clostridium butyricum]|uniref:HTH cro/C1-type domain-containing protein n=1 Tax=Clostridium butyricum TaxID=1492 RepID=A0A512TR63_CLOBU|nr:hypothetical protein [Clostridium butyricum]NOW22149.1 hypothetical protein [Clostridium butyricum]GEQ22764.1 hypothetical protein CBU02nite_32700 [Clostridium butyricum]